MKDDLAVLTEYMADHYPDKLEFVYSAMTTAREMLEIDAASREDHMFDEGFEYALDMLALIIWMTHTHPNLVFSTYSFITSYPGWDKVMRKVCFYPLKLHTLSEIKFKLTKVTTPPIRYVHQNYKDAKRVTLKLRDRCRQKDFPEGAKRLLKLLKDFESPKSWKDNAATVTDEVIRSIGSTNMGKNSSKLQDSCYGVNFRVKNIRELINSETYLECPLWV